MNNKAIAQSAVFILLFAGIIWLAADMFLETSPQVANTATEGEVITKQITSPEKVSFEKMREATRAIKSSEVTIIASELNQKFFTLRKEQLNAEIARVIAAKRKAGGISNMAGPAVSVPISHPTNAIDSSNTNLDKNSHSNSAFADATLTYFDYDRQKAFIRLDSEVIPVFEGQVIDGITIAAFKENGLLISMGSSHRLLAVPKTYATPSAVMGQLTK